MGAGDTLGKRLRAARLAAGLSQAQLQAKSGIPKPRLSQYENEHLRPSLATLSRLAAALAVSEAELIGTSDEGEAAFLAELRRLGVRFRSAGAGRAAAGEVADRLGQRHRGAS